MSTHEDHEFEASPGLPARLPAGEQLLWQGTPRWTSLAVHALHVRAFGVYFATLAVARGAYLASTGLPAGRVLVGCAGPVALALAALAILAGIAWMSARATVYTITTRRVVIRQGIALSATVNLPFRALESASIRLHGDGVGDIVLRTAGPERVGYLLLWPHVRPWRYARPEPMLRSVPDAERVGELLTKSFTAALPSGESASVGVSVARPHGAGPATPAAA